MKNMKMEFPWRYLLLSYGLAWLFWIPVALTGKDYQASPLLLFAVFIGVFGPGIAGIILTYAEQGKEGGLDFWRRMFDFSRIRKRWYLIILFLWPLMHIVAIVLNQLFGGEFPESEFAKQLAAQPLAIPMAIIMYFLQAALEELGWRGYLLEKLQKNNSLIKSSLFIGLFHTFWHLPLFLVVGTNQIKMGFGIDFVFFVISAVTATFYFSWCYMENAHSTLAVTLFHTAGNLSLDIFDPNPATLKQRVFVMLMVLGALGIINSWSKQERSVESIGSNPGKTTG